MAFTNGNDINILQAADLGIVGAGAGNDRYVLDASVLAPNQQIRISDSQGANTLQLVGDLVIVSALVANNALQLTLNNGAVITVDGASAFSFQTGGNTVNGTGGTTQSFQDFVTVSLGVAGGLPTAGAPAVTAGPVTVNPNGGTTVVGANVDPVITSDATLAATEDTAATFAVSTVDANGDTVTVTAAAANGTVVDNNDGTFSYTGNTDFNGADTITITADDGNGGVTTQTVAVTVAAVNDAPVAAAATAAAAEANTALTGQLVATDVDAGDTLSFTLDAPVGGLTVNADGSYIFDATQNATAAALTYVDAPATITANYTVTDAGGLTSQSTLTITVTPTPLTFTVVPSASSVQEGQTVSYKLVASEAVATAITGELRVVPDAEVTPGSGKASANDFVSGALNPQNVTIAVGDTESTLFTVSPLVDGITELPETYTVTASVAGVTGALSATTTILDGGIQTGVTFTPVLGTAAGADVVRLTGDQDVRIDMTNPANQIKGLDLNGDGVIANDGVENAITGQPAGFEIVDAYARNPLDEGDIVNNFLGDIRYDGTGFAGDGVNTNGNIFLGGLGADIALGGIGNDFMAGGGVADTRLAQNPMAQDALSGGRNADFFFAASSLLNKTDGNNLTIDGGSTSDDAAVGNNTAQDSDWLLLEIADDEDGTVVDLSIEQYQSVSSPVGSTISMKEIENIDASGNLYGFLDDINVQIGEGGRTVNGQNVGIGASAQLDIIGSVANNILIGGYDNDRIDGGDGDDLLMGGNLNYIVNNPNAVGIINNGMDVLIGGDGADNIVFEADGGIIEGGGGVDVDDDTADTLWLTRESLGLKSAADMTTDGVLRFDLGSGKQGGINNFAGYGGADAGGTATGFTADQTNYSDATSRVQVQDMESVIATGLGGVDYMAAGANEPELAFNNQQNHYGYQGDLTLLGTNGANTLYANTGDDVIEGRRGNDLLSGGEGNDDFIFNLARNAPGDGVDVIHRQVDANGDNLWDRDAQGDGIFGQDFGVDSTSTFGPSSLSVDFSLANLGNPNVAMSSFSVKIGGVTFAVTDMAALQAVATTAELAVLANQAFQAIDPLVTVTASGTTLTITDASLSGGRDISDTQTEGYAVTTTVNAPGTSTLGLPAYTPAGESVSQDRLLYVSYEDRADGELTNDDATNGSNISLGQDSYAQDLVVSFGADGTRLAEDQSYTIGFSNLTTQDTVTVDVNGVTYALTVGIDLDGNAIAAEDGLLDPQPLIQAAFLVRLTGFINSFMDDDTAAGSINATLNVFTSTITIVQSTYVGEQTVFMTTPVVTVTNASGGELPAAVVTNVSQHEVFLLGFDGRDGKLNGDTVQFIGETGVNRALLETAKDAGGTILGKEAIVIDGGINDLADTVSGTGAAIVNNTATNAGLALNFSVHGDDLLMGGKGNDTILAGTGDDRVHASLGNDVLDGGKQYYAVKLLGEPTSRVYVLNTWESATVAQLKATVPELAAATISSITLIQQTEIGTGVGGAPGVFSDTLMFQQADFDAGTNFTINLDNFAVAAGVVQLKNGGAGTATIDNGGDGTIDGTTTFTNFENIRTVSGTGKATAGNGQGNDTLNVSALSTATGGVLYDLTNTATAGQVSYSANPHVSLARPVVTDFESNVIRVDGVENFIGGAGDDMLVIDETEADKNNTFTGGAGDDRIDYQNNFGPFVAEPLLTIKLDNTAASAGGTDTVTMTGGRVGSTVATDTLNGVEFISLSANTARGLQEDDVLDVTSMTNGAIVNYIDGTVRDLGGNLHVTIEGIAQIENIWADGNDTVIVADADIMATNARSDFANGTPTTDLAFATFLDYDELSTAPATLNQRVAFADQTSAQISDARNQGQFTFDLSRTGTGPDVDTVDYSNALDSISVVVELDAAQSTQFVLVDQDNVANDDFHGVDNLEEDRVDVLIGVERIVASAAESVLDLTSSAQGLEIRFTNATAADRVATTATTNAYDATAVRITDIASFSPLQRTYLEFIDAADVVNVPALTTKAAAWNRIEGSDNAERVIAASSHSTFDDTYNLRGGANEVKYNELTRSITTSIAVTEWDAANPLFTGLITATTTFQDGSGNPLASSGTHTATSYTQQNGIASGSLRIAASQDAEDSLTFAGNQDQIFILGVTGTLDNQIEVKVGSPADQNSIILTGYETLLDNGSTDDVYDLGTLANVLGNLTLTDAVPNDHDTIKVGNDAANALYGGSATTISLLGLNGAFGGFDFDVLDVTRVTSPAVTTLVGTAGTDDEVVLGAINNIATLNNFESVVLTNASVAQTGTTFVYDSNALTLTGGAKVLTSNVALSAVSFGSVIGNGLVFASNEQVPHVTSGINFSVAGTGAGPLTIVGGDGADTLTGGNGNDLLVGGKGNDVLDGGFVAAVGETQTITLGGSILLGELTLTGPGGTLTISGSGAPVSDLNTLTPLPDADEIGTLLAAQTTAYIETELGYAPGSIASTAYNLGSNAFTIQFTVASGPQTNVITAAPLGLTAVAVETVASASQVESADIYVFEATAALNGVDTLNNVDASDTLNFDAFLGANNGGQNSAVVGNIGIPFGGSVVLAATDLVIGFNKATLSTADFVSGALATANKFSMVDGDRAVFAVSADVDGVPDATIDAWNLYYVTNGAVAGASDLTVTLVGTINSNTELSVANIVGLL